MVELRRCTGQMGEYWIAADTESGDWLRDKTRISVLTGGGKEPRTLSQNDMFYALYQQIGQQWDGHTERDAKHFCKLHYGVPILRNHDAEFREFYDNALKLNLSYENKLAAMEYLPVTRLMNKTQGSEYIDTVINEFTGRGFHMADPRLESQMREKAYE